MTSTKKTKMKRTRKITTKDEKRGYDAIIEANRRANLELSSALNCGPGFFDKKEDV